MEILSKARDWMIFSCNHRQFAWITGRHELLPLYGYISGAEESLFSAQDRLPAKPVPDMRVKGKIRNLKLSLSGRCNLACSYCFRHSAIPEIKDPRIAVTAIDKLLTELGPDESGYTISYNLSSEPLLHYELLNYLLNYTDQREAETGKTIFWYLLTNGTVRNPAALKIYKQVLERTGRLCVSIDGPREVHNKNRSHVGGRGSYDEVLDFIHRFEQPGIRWEAEAVITPTYPYPLNLVQHFTELGFSKIAMRFVRTTAKEDIINSEVIKGYDAYFNWLEKELIDESWAVFGMLRNDHALRPMWKLLSGIKISRRCMWGTTHLVVDGEGKYYPCDSLIGRGDWGDIQRGLDWDRFHEDLSVDKRTPCADCWARYLCGGTCYFGGILSGNDPLRVDPWECSLNKYLVVQNLRLYSQIHEKPEALSILQTQMFRN